ncbi:MAG: hypothetical protein IPO07_30785 [Haliscomenobacter sp.]|nr:hypothetical protein [Haliscomenobacter sp.]MBK9492671.1 hypothetical protein [Haliscomenobacter sp.]
MPGFGVESIDFKCLFGRPATTNAWILPNTLSSLKPLTAKETLAVGKNQRQYPARACSFPPGHRAELSGQNAAFFVATPYLDEERATFSPGGVFMYPVGTLRTPSLVQVVPFSSWKNIATGLEVVPGKPYTFKAPNFDILYDSPLLVGNLEELPPFSVAGKTHRFIGYKLGQFDKARLMNDLQKIVQASVDLIGDIPYQDYTFIAIGPGGGGIEHLNSTTFAFTGESQNNPKAVCVPCFFWPMNIFTTTMSNASAPLNSGLLTTTRVVVRISSGSRKGLLCITNT